MADDSFYYFQIARNVALGLGSTFDGLHVTNGYHPLWLLMSAAVFKLVPGIDGPLVVLFALQVAMQLGAAVFVYRALREIDEVVAALTTCLFLASYRAQGTLFDGMESSVAFFLLSWLLLLALRWRDRFLVPRNSRDALAIFLLLLGLSLSRLEAGLLPALWLVTAWIFAARRGWRERRRVVWIGVGLSAAAVTYVTVNLRLVGLPFPVSGLVKWAPRLSLAWIAKVFTSHRDAFAGLIGPPGSAAWARFIRIGEELLLVAGTFGLLRDLRRRDPVLLPGLVLFLAFAAGFVAFSSIVTSGVWSWYGWAALLAGIVATFALIRQFSGTTGRADLVRGLVLVVAVLSTITSWYLTTRTRALLDWGPPGVLMDATIRFIREEIPANERIMGLSSGMYTYFSGRRIENLEGLANGVEFFRARRSPASFGDYLRRNRIRWVVYPGGDRTRVVSELERSCAVDRVVDIDDFYHLDLRPSGGLANPNVLFLRLRI